MQQALTGHVSSLLHDRDSREVFLRFASRSVADRLHGTIRSPGCLYRVLWGGAGDRETGDNRMDGWMDGYPVAVLLSSSVWVSVLSLPTCCERIMID